MILTILGLLLYQRQVEIRHHNLKKSLFIVKSKTYCKVLHDAHDQNIKCNNLNVTCGRDRYTSYKLNKNFTLEGSFQQCSVVPWNRCDNKKH